MKKFLLALMLCPTLMAAPARANPFETRLSNGLRIIVKEDHRAPTAVNMVWYQAGAMDEQEGVSGVAHVLEHMMFKGTKKIGPGEFSRRVAAAGGNDNAFTTADYTAYFEQVPKARLAEMMAMEADRMAHLELTEKEFSSEIKVVMEERRWRTEDQPQSKVYEGLMATAFEAHPYHRPVIGWMGDLENMTYQDARDWYRTWYAPNNATVVVVGDVDHKVVFRLAEKEFGAIPARALPRRRPRTEPVQEGIRRISVKAPARLPYLMMAWKAPKLQDVHKDRDPYALEVLSGILDGHEAARLGRHLVREQRIAQSAGAGYDGTLRGEALFILDGQPAQGHTIAELEAALRAEIKRIQDEGVSAEELARVKVQTIAGQVYKRDSMMAQAMEIGGAEMNGLGWRSLDTLLEKVRSVTADEVQAVARKYFSDDTLTVAVLDPQPVDANAPPRPAPVHHH
ncbi:MAG: insulinase family protein [Proteobacteria bacterium]|nr:insulinase family protein [Pseudomonadota bacterium]HQR03892.1 pitrilysin family protein [Rhodocyclaceae bacterium]